MNARSLIDNQSSQPTILGPQRGDLTLEAGDLVGQVLGGTLERSFSLFLLDSESRCRSFRVSFMFRGSRSTLCEPEAAVFRLRLSSSIAAALAESSVVVAERAEVEARAFSGSATAWDRFLVAGLAVVVAAGVAESKRGSAGVGRE